MLRNRLRNLVGGMRLPRPDESGLAMTKSVVLDDQALAEVR